jgi:hypothetical protein
MNPRSGCCSRCAPVRKMARKGRRVHVARGTAFDSSQSGPAHEGTNRVSLDAAWPTSRAHAPSRQPAGRHPSCVPRKPVQGISPTDDPPHRQRRRGIEELGPGQRRTKAAAPSTTQLVTWMGQAWSEDPRHQPGLRAPRVARTTKRGPVPTRPPAGSRMAWSRTGNRGPRRHCMGRRTEMAQARPPVGGRA